MSTLHLYAPRVKASPDLPPGSCLDCRGAGQIDGGPCPTCEATGRVVVGFRPSAIDPALRTVYHAVSGVDDGSFDTGKQLDRFLAKLLREWQDSADDIMVLKTEGPWGGARLVAVLKPKAHGGLTVVYV